MSKQERTSKIGLASASHDTRERVARAGGEAPHKKRGLQAASSETREYVAKKGGLARGEQRRKSHHQKITPLSGEGETEDEEADESST